MKWLIKLANISFRKSLYNVGSQFDRFGMSDHFGMSDRFGMSDCFGMSTMKVFNSEHSSTEKGSYMF